MSRPLTLPPNCTVEDCPELRVRHRRRCRRHDLEHERTLRLANKARPCVLEGCDRPRATTYAYCGAHLYRLRTYGHPLPEVPIPGIGQAVKKAARARGLLSDQEEPAPRQKPRLDQGSRGSKSTLNDPFPGVVPVTYDAAGEPKEASPDVERRRRWWAVVTNGTLLPDGVVACDDPLASGDGAEIDVTLGHDKSTAVGQVETVCVPESERRPLDRGDGHSGQLVGHDGILP